jgi:NADPH-dependent glutamate synthase beta subunit-like oxidoreductase
MGECSSKELSRPIDISGLQRFVMDYEMKTGMVEPVNVPKTKGPVAVVGAGPAGLGAAAELAARGCNVTVFESETAAGGMLKYCIPSFRLPDDVVDFEIEFIKKLGVEFRFGTKVDDPKKLLSEGFKAVFIGAGLWKSKKVELIGSETKGVYDAVDFLKRAKRGEMPDVGKRVLVIGGGDTALDAARIAKRAGAESFIVYRRTQKEMPAYSVEVADAWNEGIEFYFRTIPRAVTGGDQVKGLRCVRIKWHKDVMPGMQRGYDVEGTEFVIACDAVIIAAGQEPAATFGLRASPAGQIAVSKDTFETSERGIFAGGDVIEGGGTAAKAVGMGKLAAAKIDEYISK